MKRKNIIAINIGSTSTKVAFYDGTQCVWTENCRHDPEQLHAEGEIFDQYEFRMANVMKALEKHGLSCEEIDVAIAPGGLLPSTKQTHVSAGAYRVGKTLMHALKDHPLMPHPVNMGPWICDAIAQKSGGRCIALAYDATTVDEMDPVLKITGFPPIAREARGHNLNMRTMAIRHCEENGMDYKAQNIIIAHMGGGTTVALHAHGRILDMISDDILPFSPTRCGGVPAYDLVRYAINSGKSAEEMVALLSRKSGLMGHLGTTDIKAVEKRIADGDKQAADVLLAMSVNVAKAIAELAAVVCGKVDHVILTGGIAHSRMVTDWIVERVQFLAPVHVMPGEAEMLGLAMGATRVLDDLEDVREYLD